MRGGPGSRSGVRFSSTSRLVARALEELREGPVPSSRLAGKVLGLRGAPPGMAHRMVDELLGNQAGVEYRDGAWRLLGRTRPAGGRLDELEYVVVDVETTGTAPSRGDRVTEIAAVRVEGGRIAGEFSTLVDPGRTIPPEVQGITGITDEMVADAPAFSDVAEIVQREVEGRIFTAHNAPFDWRFVSEEMRRARSMVPDGPRLCTLRLARRALPGLPRKGLDTVARHYGVEVERRHRALGDALATAAVLLRLLEEADRKGISAWTGLQRWLGGSPPPAET